MDDSTSLISQNIYNLLIPTEEQKIKNAEYGTPYKLRKDMIDSLQYINVKYWESPKKIFEPCCGKGGFLVDIYFKFMYGLKNMIPHDLERSLFIIEECLHFVDIDSNNIKICKNLLDSLHTKIYLNLKKQSKSLGNIQHSILKNTKPKFNCYIGDVINDNKNNGNKTKNNKNTTSDATTDENCLLNINIKDDSQLIKLQKYDLIIGNPPFNISGKKSTGNTIWQHFVNKSLLFWLNNNGLLLFVSPPGWRKPNTTRSKYYGLYDLMVKRNNMIHLSIHSWKEGKTLFNCGTRYDWFLIQRKIENSNHTNYRETIVNDEKNKTYKVKMWEYDWFPNYNFPMIQTLLVDQNNGNKEHCPIMYNRSNYGSDKNYVSHENKNNFRFPIIHTIPKKGIRYLYSSTNNRGHFNIPKVIFSDNGFNDVIIDMNGKYGMSENSMGIRINSREDGEKIKKCLMSQKFKDLIQACIMGNYRIDWRLFLYFRRDFYTLL
jgi:hypothetical protein